MNPTISPTVSTVSLKNLGGLSKADLFPVPLGNTDLSGTAKKLKKRLRNRVGKAVTDFKMIEDGDRIMVCLSGGKDSYTMLDMLLELKKAAPIDFDLHVVNLDQKQPGFPEHVLPAYLDSMGVSYHILEQDTYSVVKRVIPEGKTTCGLCSRMRRGALYAYAKEHGIRKIALGHHREDIIETFFLNLFHAGQVKAMPARYTTDDGAHEVIRPLAYCAEKDIAQYSRAREFPIIPCNLCGSQTNLQRVKVKKMLADWDEQSPGRVETMFTSLQNVVPSHMLDTSLLDL